MSGSVLVADHDREFTGLVRERFQSEGFLCLEAFDGSGAALLLRDGLPDALVLSLGLSGGSCLELLQKSKSINPFSTVVVVADPAEKGRQSHILAVGADRFFVKPIEVDALFEGVSQAIAHSRWEREVFERPHWPGEAVDQWMGRLFLSAPAALIHVDPDDVIRVVNREAAKLLGSKPEFILGRSILDIVGTQVTGKWLEAVRRDAASPRGYEGELYMKRGEDAFFSAYATAVERPEEGHLLFSVRDLSRQKALEEQLLQSKKLASLGKVVEGVAHEVRNPLISIGGFARKMRRETPRESRECQYLDIILKEVQRLETMVNDIEQYVGFAQTDPHIFRSEDLGEIVTEAYNAARSAPKNRDSVVASLTVPEGAPSVFGDRDQLLELFNALLENAYNAMPDGGELKVMVGFLESWVRVHVMDTGKGIEAGVIEDVFDPFFTSKTTGAGLGLAKSYMICEDHGGHIYLDSVPGEGTTCTVILPIDRRQTERKGD